MKMVKLLWFSLALMAMVVLSTAQKNRPEGRSMECLQCVSYTSWADCFSSVKNGKCPEGGGKCAKIQSGGAFIAACANLQLCGGICKGQENCEVECCSEDLCNGGIKPEPEDRSPQLQCLECVNSSSWADCVSSGQNIQCPAGLSNCAKIRVGESITATCASLQFCEDNMCKGQEDCDIECCSEDMCNNFTTPEPEGHSLECLECANSSSWAECVSSGKNVQCSKIFTNCAKIRINQTFTATCSIPLLCDMCEGLEDCDIECCSGDMCNNGSEPQGSSVGKALSCLMCRSNSSMDDCTKHQKVQACPSERNRCGAISVRGQEEAIFGKGCIYDNMCQVGCGGAGGQGAVCELSCCGTSYCNE